MKKILLGVSVGLVAVLGLFALNTPLDSNDAKIMAQETTPGG